MGGQGGWPAGGGPAAFYPFLMSQQVSTPARRPRSLLPAMASDAMTGDDACRRSWFVGWFVGSLAAAHACSHACAMASARCLVAAVRTASHGRPPEAPARL